MANRAWNICALLLALLSITLAEAAALQARKPPDDVDICHTGTWCNGDCCTHGTHCTDNGCISGSPPPPPPPEPGTIWFTTYTTGPQCDDDTCWTTSNDGYPRIQVHGAYFSPQAIQVGIYPYTPGTPVWTGTGSAGGSWVVDTGVVECPAQAGGAKEAYVQAFDPGTGLWSNRIDVSTGCFLW